MAKFRLSPVAGLGIGTAPEGNGAGLSLPHTVPGFVVRGPQALVMGQADIYAEFVRRIRDTIPRTAPFGLADDGPRWLRRLRARAGWRTIRVVVGGICEKNEQALRDHTQSALRLRRRGISPGDVLGALLNTLRGQTRVPLVELVSSPLVWSPALPHQMSVDRFRNLGRAASVGASPPGDLPAHCLIGAPRAPSSR